jgi:Coenzyme PQQ synthesis protein D (PqqD)
VRRYRTSGPTVVSETVDHETIVVDLESGTYYDLNHVGAAIWTTLLRGATMDEVAGKLTESYGADAGTAASDVDGLVSQLVEEGLLVATNDVPASGNGASPGPEAGATLPYESPRLTRHSDMQELLLLDPIHEVEVDETSWPGRR